MESSGRKNRNMSLLDYESQFSKLRINKRNGKVSPHKIAMLLAVISLIEKGLLLQNRIYFNDNFRDEFTNQFNKLADSADSNNPCLPYFHLRSSGFWHHQLKPGKQTAYAELTTIGNVSGINEYIQYVYLDEELYELLNNLVVRNMLSAALFQNLEDQDRSNLLNVGKGWNWIESEIVVDLYFRMLEMQVANQAYVKTHLYRELLPRLNNRSIKLIEAKCQNVSAVMVQHGYPYVIGLKPLWNYQKQLEKVVLSQLIGSEKKLAEVIDKTLVISTEEDMVINWDSVLDTDIPEHIPGVREPQSKYLAHKIDYSQRESNNRKLGECGEEFVLEYEKRRMTNAGRSDLINDVEWSSKIQGDGLGYDIRSFNPENDDELFIEVKTTNSGKYQPFFISHNEVNYSKEFADAYSLYRVYQYKMNPRLFCMNGDVSQHVNLNAKTYKASFS